MEEYTRREKLIALGPEKLADALLDLADWTDAATGLNLLCDFFQCDSSIFARCDDSGGRVGDVFRFDATTLFVEYAMCFDDKDALAEMLL